MNEASEEVVDSQQSVPQGVDVEKMKGKLSASCI